MRLIGVPGIVPRRVSEAALEYIARQHQSEPDEDVCRMCGEPWPCQVLDLLSHVAWLAEGGAA